jgi:GR25 family glycosyltransferase involved in LPS biosynthesis
LLIYEEFLGSDKNYLLVFEDDIFLAPNFYAALQEIMDEVKKGSCSNFLFH